jgi:hypothetical protein
MSTANQQLNNDRATVESIALKREHIQQRIEEAQDNVACIEQGTFVRMALLHLLSWLLFITIFLVIIKKMV